ncbi:zf-HC2 domain-containing protein [Anaerobacillus arseniciselenatis]|uniref:zf-HC2 domain-containing protein n=1 Tax=Anaerobacillus arseniciselenatis TaxID=85682 RepID=UPI000A001A3C
MKENARWKNNMKFDCEVVQDLYVIYEENELSPNVRARVDEHLQSCSTCRKI